MSKDLTNVPTSAEMQLYQLMAKTASQSKMFEKLGGESGILTVMLMARELGLAPMQSIMGGMNVIQGKVELSPRLMNSMIRKAGHIIEILESNDQICKLKGVRHDTREEYPCVFSIEDARKASLIRPGGGWEKYPSDMLFARCLSRLARRLFADVISTAYIEGELEDADVISVTSPLSELFASPEQIEEARQLMNHDPDRIQKMLDTFSVEGMSQISFHDMEKAIEGLRKKAAKEKS
jgi:hypothetical protein